MKYYTEKSKTGLPTLYFIRANRKIYLHSKYNPEIEVKNIVSKYEFTKYDYIIILGLGLGYLLKEVCVRTDNKSKIYVIEKDEKIYSIYKNTKIYITKSVKFYINQNQETIISDILKQFNIAFNKGILVIELPSITGLYPEYYENFKKLFPSRFDEIVNYQMTTAKLWNCVVQNFFKNLENIERFKILKFEKHKLKDKYAVIVSAGPSLEKDINTLKEIQKYVYIFSVDTALKYLLHNDIIPDFVFSIDPQYQSILHFENLKIPENVCIILDVFSSFILARKLKNISFILSNNIITQSAFPDFLWILDPSCGSVTNFIFQFVIKAGFKNIVFTGLDLCYPEGKMYIPHNYLTYYWAERIDKFNTIKRYYFEFYKSRARTLLNNKYYTSHSMIGYHKWLNQQLHQSENNIFISKNSIAQFGKIKTVNLARLKSTSKDKVWELVPIGKETMINAIKKLQSSHTKAEIIKLLLYSRYFEKLKTGEYDKAEKDLERHIEIWYNRIIQKSKIF